MKKLSISFLGRDCPGAVSTVSQILGQSGCNIVEVTQTILSGEFAAIFIVQAPDTLEQEGLRRMLLTGLEAAGQDLSVLVRPAVEGQWGTGLVCEPFVVTADGPDHTGQIAAMSRIFAQHSINIESLKAILGEGGPTMRSSCSKSWCRRMWTLAACAVNWWWKARSMICA